MAESDRQTRLGREWNAMNIWIVARTEIVRMMRTRAFYFVLFVLPFMLILILGSALDGTFGEEDVEIVPVRVAVLLEDRGELQDGIRTFLDSPDIVRYIKTVSVSAREEAEASVRSGETDFGLVVPAGFGESVIRGHNANWEFLYGRSSFKNRTAETVLGSFIEQTNTIQAVHIVLGAEKAGDLQAAGGNAAAGASGDTGVRAGSLNKEKKSASAIQYYAAAELIMFLLYGGMLAASSLTKERDEHTLARLSMMPVPPSAVLSGKIIGQGILALIQAGVIIAGTSLLYGVDWGSSYGLLAVVIVLSIVSSMSLALLVTLLVKSRKAIISVFQTLIIIMTMLSGGFMPVDGLLAKIGLFTVNHWASDSILRIMLESGTQDVLRNIAVLGMIAAGLLLVSFGAYRKVGYRE